MTNLRFSTYRGTICLSSLILVISGCTPADMLSSKPVLKKEDIGKATPVKAVTLSSTPVERTTMQPATVHAFYSAEVRAKASGFVTRLRADIGDVVKKGDILAEIDVPEMKEQRRVIEARIRGLEAKEKSAESGIELAEARVESAEAKLEQAKSQLESAKASLAASEAEFSRTQDMVNRKSLQERMLDEVRKKRDSEKANQESAAALIVSADAEIAVAKAEKTSAEAKLDSAQAQTDITRRELDELDVLIAYARIKAPFDGVVTIRNLEPGDLVREANEVGKGEPLFVVSQMDRLRVRIPVPELDAPLVNKGDAITLTFPSFSAEDPIVAKVTRRTGSLDPSTRTMMVEAELDNSNGKLLPGMFGQAMIQLTGKVDTNTLPSQAIRFTEDGKAYVYVIGKDQTVSVASIQTGNDDGNSIEVVSGIQPGQQVIGSHLKRFRDGERVAVLAN